MKTITIQEFNQLPVDTQAVFTWEHEGQPWAQTLLSGIGGWYTYDYDADNWVKETDSDRGLEATFAEVTNLNRFNVSQYDCGACLTRRHGFYLLSVCPHR